MATGARSVRIERRPVFHWYEEELAIIFKSLAVASDGFNCNGITFEELCSLVFCPN